MIRFILVCTIVYEIYAILGLYSYDHFNTVQLMKLNSIISKETVSDQLHRKIKYTSGLTNKMKHLNVYNFYWCTLVCFSIGFCANFYYTRLLLASIVMGSVSGFIPFLILGSFQQKSNQALAHELTNFISIMARWSHVNDDIFYCFEKTEHQVNGPLSQIISSFLMQVKYTGNIQQSFDQMLLYSDNELFRNFIINIKQAEFCKGDLCILFERLEEEAYRIEGEHARRNSETRSDRLMISITIVLVFIISVIVLFINQPMQAFYLGTPLGQYLLTLYTVLFLLGIVSASKMTGFNY